MRIRRKKWVDKELEECPFYFDSPIDKKGNWKEYFKQDAPIQLELGCGKGSFIAKLASMHPETNYIAVDMIDTMLGLAKRNIEKEYGEKPIDNLILVRMDIERIFLIIDETDVIDRIYINFCNPWPKGKHRKKRLTYPKQLELYKAFLKKNGEIHFKTDDDGLFEDSLKYFQESGFKILRQTRNLHEENIFETNIITEHEEMFSSQGIKIKALIAKYAK